MPPALEFWCRRSRRPPRRRLNVEPLESRCLWNGSPLTAAAVPYFNALGAAHATRFLAGPGEVDLFKVALRAGDALAADVNTQVIGSGLRSLLRVFDAAGKPLALDDREGGDPRLTFQAATAGTYFVGVSSAPNDAYDPTVAVAARPGATTGSYTLDLERSSAALRPDLAGSALPARRGDRRARRRGSRLVRHRQPRRGRPRQLYRPSAAGRQQPVRRLGAGAGDVAPFRPRRERVGPDLLVRGRVRRDDPLGPGVRADVRRPADRAGRAGRRLERARQERRPPRGRLGAVDRRDARAGGRDRSVGGRCRPERDGVRHARPDRGGDLHVRRRRPRGRPADGGGADDGRHAGPASDPVGAVGPRADPVGRRADRAAPDAGYLLPHRLDPVRARGVPAGHDVRPDRRPLRPAPVRGRAGVGGGGRLQRRRHPRRGHRQPHRRTRSACSWASATAPSGTPRPSPSGRESGGSRWGTSTATACPTSLTGNKGDNTVSVLLGNGDGTFRPRIVVPAGTRVAGATVADVNGDGKPDLVMDNYAADTIWVVLGNGDGTFQAPRIYPTDDRRAVPGAAAGDGRRRQRRRHPRPDLPDLHRRGHRRPPGQGGRHVRPGTQVRRRQGGLRRVGWWTSTATASPTSSSSTPSTTP